MELPSIREELSRKALDSLQRLLIDRTTGDITEAQFNIGINTLWDTVSGLVEKDFFEMISMVKVNRNDPSFKRHTMMVCREHWIMTTVDTTALCVTVHRNGGSPPQEIMCESIKEALEKAEKIHCKVGLSGYAKIN